jgi:hypothetical protein
MIYSFFNTLIKGYLKYRRSRIHQMYNNPLQLQEEVRVSLVDRLKNTRYGQVHRVHSVQSFKDFQQALPIVEYEELFPYIDHMMQGEPDQLWPGKVNWFAKSSGTTNDRSKFIPITDDNLFENHVAASWDAMSILYSNRSDTKIFESKNLVMGGSLNPIRDSIYTGDVSAILLHRMPAIGRPFYTPDFETALMADFEAKIEKIAHQCSKEDVAMFAGVPTWTIVLFNRILELTGKDNICEVWPNAKTYLHGGVSFEPYVDQFKRFLPRKDMEYYEVYNASEGYFAIQDRLDVKGMLLLLDNAIFYEFIPLEDIHQTHPTTLTLDQVVLNKDYCIVISTSSGLWRYKPGDTVRFVSLAPYRVMVSGRTKHYINVFGEEVMVHNTDRALKETCEEHNAAVKDYSVAPVYIDGLGKGGHEWIIEFSQPPLSLKQFELTLDKRLRANNSDYDAKRTADLALVNLKIVQLGTGSFEKWLASKGRLGGQSKIPRLSNNREFVENMINFVNATK